MFETYIDGMRGTTPLEAVSVGAGLAYALLAVKRSRWCWVAGGISSGILVYLAARGRLPMQATLQAYYVGMSFYGFWRWSGQQDEAAKAVTTWPIRSHLIAWACILALSALSARWLAAETQAAWPFLDSVMVFLFVKQGMMFVASLFAAYLIISMFGFVSWSRNYRQHAPAS